jgi:Subtilisin inhibitor-like
MTSSMTSSQYRTATPTSLRLLPVAGLAGLLLAGCGSGTSSATPGDTGPGSTVTSDGATVGGPTDAPGTATETASSPTVSSPPAVPRTVVATGPKGVTGSGAPVPWSTASASARSSYPSADPGAVSLSILLDDGFGTRSTWTLTCGPVGGTHPTPAVACGVLGAKGAKSLPEVAEASTCAQLYGGPEKVRITGTWKGKAVDSQQTRENGCEIDRWNALVGLLPPGSETP